MSFFLFVSFLCGYKQYQYPAISKQQIQTSSRRDLNKWLKLSMNEWMNESTKLCSDLTELPDRYPLRNPLVPLIVLGSVNNQKEVKVLAWTLLFKSSQVYLYSAFPNISQQQTQNVALTFPNGPMRFFLGGGTKQERY